MKAFIQQTTINKQKELYNYKTMKNYNTYKAVAVGVFVHNQNII